MAGEDQAVHREGEIAVDLPEQGDASVYFIGRINTPWTDRAACPKNAAESDAICKIILDQRYAAGLKDLDSCSHVILLYFMDRAPRNLIVQVPRHYGEPRGVFALRSPARPNPIALSVAELIAIEGNCLQVRGLDCLDGTPLLDIKPYFASTDSRPHAVVGWRENRDREEA